MPMQIHVSAMPQQPGNKELPVPVVSQFKILAHTHTHTLQAAIINAVVLGALALSFSGVSELAYHMENPFHSKCEEVFVAIL